MFHFIFDYNYDNFRQILIIFLPQETGMNTLPNLYKLSLQPDYVSTLHGKTKNDTKTADRLCSAFCWTNCSRLLEKVVQRSFLSVFVRTFL